MEVNAYNVSILEAGAEGSQIQGHLSRNSHPLKEEGMDKINQSPRLHCSIVSLAPYEVTQKPFQKYLVCSPIPEQVRVSAAKL